MVCFTNIKEALLAPTLLLRTLKDVTIDHASLASGGNSISARCTVADREGCWLLKCYTRRKPHTKEIYGNAYYPEELGVKTFGGTVTYIDVVLTPWVEGRPLDALIGDPNADYATLSREFDKLAYATLASPNAHGDVKPENIIVGSNGVMTLIDLDAQWQPGFGYSTAGECGTMQYRHPSRSLNYADKSIDDYPLSLISTALAALALDSGRMSRYINIDKTLFCPERCITKNDEALNEALAIFCEHRDVIHYIIAEGLMSPFPVVYRICDLFKYATRPYSRIIPDGAQEKLFEGNMGFTINGEWIIPPLFKRFVKCNNNTIEAHYKDIVIELKCEGDYIKETYDEYIDRRTKFIERLRSEQHYDLGRLGRGGMYNNGKPWCDDEELILAALISDGHSLATIAHHLGRSTTAVRARIAKAKLPMPKSKQVYRQRRRY